MFGILGSLGASLWLLYNKMIFNDNHYRLRK